jgi:hypothetical protein
MTIAAVTVHDVSLYFSTPAVNRRFIKYVMVTITNKRKVLSIKEKVILIQEIENGKRKLTCVGNFICKFCSQRDLEKQNRITSVSEQNRLRIERLLKPE